MGRTPARHRATTTGPAGSSPASRAEPAPDLIQGVTRQRDGGVSALLIPNPLSRHHNPQLIHAARYPR